MTCALGRFAKHCSGKPKISNLKDHWTLKTGYFEDPTPAMQVQNLPLEGPRSLGKGVSLQRSSSFCPRPGDKKNILAVCKKVFTVVRHRLKICECLVPKGKGDPKIVSLKSGQIIIVHQPRFPWNKGISLTKPPFGGNRSCGNRFPSLAIFWGEVVWGH